jgi:HAD superfamily hydrolase (TIGR01509 family)
MPGALGLVRRCAAKVPIAVASNSPRLLLDMALQRSGPSRLVRITVSADDALRPKPDADVYSSACGLLGVISTESVAFEDSAIGMRAARAAGLFVIAVPSQPEEQYDHHAATLTDDDI